MLGRRPGEEEPCQPSFLDEETSEERSDLRRLLTRLAVTFALLFAAVFLAFWWSGSAVRFGAARVADRAVPTWRVWGVVTDGKGLQPVPWAHIEDDPASHPPYFMTDADQNGLFSLLTLAEPHRIRVTAPG